MTTTTVKVKTDWEPGKLWQMIEVAKTYFDELQVGI